MRGVTTALAVLVTACGTHKFETRDLDVQVVEASVSTSSVTAQVKVANRSGFDICLSSQMLGMTDGAGADFVELRDQNGAIIGRRPPGYPVFDEPPAQYDLRIRSGDTIGFTYASTGYSVRDARRIRSLTFHLVGYRCDAPTKEPIDFGYLGYLRTGAEPVDGLVAAGSSPKLLSTCTYSPAADLVCRGR